jgi:hypothetical protein
VARFTGFWPGGSPASGSRIEISSANGEHLETFH